MKKTWVKFKRDRFYLAKSFLFSHICLAGLIALLLSFGTSALRPDLSLWHLSLLPLSLILGIKIPVFMHNCMHSNFKGQLINEWGGECAGFFALISLNILRINHLLHHAHSDTEKDPHSPSGKSFIHFFMTAQFSGAGIIKEKYLKYHGHRPHAHVLFNATIALHYMNQWLRLLTWFLCLGPAFFFSLYLPAFITYSLAFAHVNYITHKSDEQGATHIININSNFYYQFINFIGSGVYFHRNHHLRPQLLNPQLMMKEDRP